MSRFLSAEDVTNICQLLSQPRLQTFRDLTRSDEDAIELHQATMSLGVAIMAVTGLIEVSLRNAVCSALTGDLGVADWLRKPPSGLNWHDLEVSAISTAEKRARRAEYSKMTDAEQAALDRVAYPSGVPAGIKHRKLVEIRRAAISISDSQIIAQLTMGFWKRLFSEHYEKTLWNRSLKGVFPNKTYPRSLISDHLYVLHETRNRLAHHEPIYGSRLESILRAIEFITENLGVRIPSPEAPLAKLIMPQRDILVGQVEVFNSTLKRLRP